MKTYYDKWKEEKPSIPLLPIIEARLAWREVFDDMRKKGEGDEAWIKRNKELEEQISRAEKQITKRKKIDEQVAREANQAFFELIKRDPRYLQCDYTMYKIYSWQEIIAGNENKEKVKEAKKCLEKIGKALIPIRKCPHPSIDIDNAVFLYHKLRELFEDAKKQHRHRQLNWNALYEKYSKILHECLTSYKPLVEKHDFVAELTGGGEGRGYEPSEIALNCLGKELVIGVETLKKNLKRRKDFTKPPTPITSKRLERLRRQLEEKGEHIPI